LTSGRSSLNQHEQRDSRVSLQRSVLTKVALGVVLLAIGFSLVSANVNPVSGYVVIGRGCLRCGYWYGGRFLYYPGYSFYNGYYYYGGYPPGYYSTPQYTLTINTNPPSLGGVSGAGTYASGSTASFTANQTISPSVGTRYVFQGWSGAYSGSGSTGSLTMSSSQTVTAQYQLQYFVSVSQQPSIAPTPQGGGWYNQGASVNIAGPPQNVSQGAGSQLVFAGWTVDGNNQAGPTLSLQMNSPHTVVAQYTQQYYLTVQSPQGVTSGQGWYNAGSNAQISVTTPPSPMFGVNWVFDGWQGSTPASTQTATITMNGPMAETAAWHQDSTVLYATVGAIIAILAAVGAVFYRTKHKRPSASAPSTQPSVATG